VDGTDAAVQRVRDNGGTVIAEPFDFEYGRIAIVAGPDGEPFGVITSAPMPARPVMPVISRRRSIPELFVIALLLWS